MSLSLETVVSLGLISEGAAIKLTAVLRCCHHHRLASLHRRNVVQQSSALLRQVSLHSQRPLNGSRQLLQLRKSVVRLWLRIERWDGLRVGRRVGLRVRFEVWFWGGWRFSLGWFQDGWRRSLRWSWRCHRGEFQGGLGFFLRSRVQHCQ